MLFRSMATAKRAREIIDGNMPLVPVKNGEKPLSVAIDELNQAKIKVAAEEEPKDMKEQKAGDVQEEQSVLEEAVK